MALRQDETTNGRAGTSDQPGLSGRRAREPNGYRSDDLAGRLPGTADTAPALRALRKRGQDLRPGHPSSPLLDDGTPRPDEPSLRDIETPEPPLSDADWADHLANVTNRLDKARADGQMTDLLHTINADHDIWTDGRTARHDEILNEMYSAAADVPCSRMAVIAGGLGGAGKTTVLDQHAGIDRSQYLMINPDDFKVELASRNLLPQVHGLSPMEASALAHKESSYLAKRLALRAMADGKNIIWDITMSSVETTAGRIDELRDAGYGAVDGVFVGIPVEVSVARAEARHRNGHDKYLAGTGLGGRPLPAEVIWSQADHEYGSVNRRAFETVKSRLDTWAVYDNSVDGRPPVLIKQGQGSAAEIRESRWPAR